MMWNNQKKKIMSELSLMQIMSKSEDIGARIQKKAEEVKIDRQNLLKSAGQYSDLYREEIDEGTLLRSKLLTEGKNKGLTEEQVMANYGKFLPSVRTPLLNMLYFMLREADGDPVFGKSLYEKRDQINELLKKSNKLDHKEDDIGNEKDDEEFVDSIYQILRNETKNETREKIQELLQQQRKTSSESDAQLKDTPAMVEFLYGNVTLEVFNKIKKLKALSKSANEEEAFQAYRKANELCKQYNLDFDQIPCYVQGK
jgi:hypothetical protein